MKLISGGQTGADRGALEAALDVGTPYGGWVPKGRRAEDGQVPARFMLLQEHDSSGYPPRTRANVADADATVILARLPLAVGSKLTLRFAREQEKPVRIYGAQTAIDRYAFCVKNLYGWILEHRIEVLNVAGSRESSAPGLQSVVRQIFGEILRRRHADLMDEVGLPRLPLNPLWERA